MYLHPLCFTFMNESMPSAVFKMNWFKTIAIKNFTNSYRQSGTWELMKLNVELIRINDVSILEFGKDFQGQSFKGYKFFKFVVVYFSLALENCRTMEPPFFHCIK